VRLDCELRGPGRPPVDLGPIDIRARIGVERSPVDLQDDAAVRWLRACIWPDMAARLARFDAAVEVARAAPPQVLAGDLVDRLGDAIAELPTDVAVVVYYERTVPWVEPAAERPSTEAADVPTQLALATWDPTRREGAAFRQVTLAWMHSHGTWMEWLDGA
jgi:hypothetical protein